MKTIPSTPEELAAALAEASVSRKTISLEGAGSKRRFGGAPLAADVEISTTALNRVLAYEPNDLTVSVEAGMRWADFQKLLAENRQMVPLDPIYSDSATVGGVLAANCSGPRRRQFGSPRDAVIGMKFATLAGQIISSGGMVVKNVAGLDMAKLLIGSFGTLGAITVANFKLSPVPAVSRTFLFRFSSLADGMARRNAILAGVLQPWAIDLVRESGDWLLAVQAGGSEKVMERYSREFAQAESVENSFWDNVREFVPGFLAANGDGCIVRVSTVLQDMEAVARSTESPLLARAGNGVTYLAFADPGAAGHWMVKMKKPEWRAVVETNPYLGEQWPEPGNELAVMEKIKRMFDPNHLLNKGRLYGRI